MKLDLGCGIHKKEGFIGVDKIAFEGVDIIYDLSIYPWPWEDGSVDEVHCSHVIEHLPAMERIKFVNELYRILKIGGTACLIAPHYASGRAYGDMTHQWPPVCEMWLYYLRRSWRLDEGNAPHDDITYNPDGYSCDFDGTWGYSINPALSTRNQEYQQYALQWFREAAMDIMATLTKRA